ncbi:hypothetical protein ANO14919_021790 [Xylariales sp. No.14919]|nr:hypothetical protein F5X98DRAFT_386982 [Xylaria grammica]GAW12808.1 hypothetical protein ANO14919_021790 [Xylariales sp. No.14919]
MPSELVYQHQQQTPINGTISGMAPPGNETGYYYIPFANLPWQTSWQELKDHVRTVCSVEHVEINEDSTSGHVLVRGRANFDAAFRLLNGGIFHDRALIADGRNGNGWVLVKKHIDGPASSPPSPVASRYTATPTHHASLMTAQPSTGYVEWSATSASPSYMISPVMDSSSYFVPPVMPEYTDPATIYAMSSCSLEHSRAVVSPAAPYPYGPGYTQQYTPSEYDGRVLEVRHTNEALYNRQTAHGSRSSHQRHSHHSHHPRRERHDGKDKKGKEKEQSHKAGSSSGKKSKLSSESDVVIAHGTSISYV